MRPRLTHSGSGPPRSGGGPASIADTPVGREPCWPGSVVSGARSDEKHPVWALRVGRCRRGTSCSRRVGALHGARRSSRRADLRSTARLDGRLSVLSAAGGRRPKGPQAVSEGGRWLHGEGGRSPVLALADVDPGRVEGEAPGRAPVRAPDGDEQLPHGRHPRLLLRHPPSSLGVAGPEKPVLAEHGEDRLAEHLAQHRAPFLAQPRLALVLPTFALAEVHPRVAEQLPLGVEVGERAGLADEPGEVEERDPGDHLVDGRELVLRLERLAERLDPGPERLGVGLVDLELRHEHRQPVREHGRDRRRRGGADGRRSGPHEALPGHGLDARDPSPQHRSSTPSRSTS